MVAPGAGPATSPARAAAAKKVCRTIEVFLLVVILRVVGNLPPRARAALALLQMISISGLRSGSRGN
ncbi:hypothetical protein JCM30394_14730 [Deferrisoma palaeochoriense]